MEQIKADLSEKMQ